MLLRTLLLSALAFGIYRCFPKQARPLVYTGGYLALLLEAYRYRDVSEAVLVWVFGGLAVVGILWVQILLSTYTRFSVIDFTMLPFSETNPYLAAWVLLAAYYYVLLLLCEGCGLTFGPLHPATLMCKLPPLQGFLVLAALTTLTFVAGLLVYQDTRLSAKEA